MKATRYRSGLRGVQVAETRRSILAAVGAILDRGEEPTFAGVASEVGCEQRTVYRHFPTKDDLASAYWTDQEKSADVARPESEPELLAAVRPVFASFDARDKRIRAMLHTEHGRAARLSDNAQRQAAFAKVVAAAAPGLSAGRRKRAAATLQLLFSAASWESLRDYWGLEGDAAATAVTEAMNAILDGLRRDARSTKPSTRK